MLGAFKALRKVQRQQLAAAELPVAQLTALMANINRDPKKSKPFTASQFAIYAEERERETSAVFRPEVAAVALALRHEQQAPALLLTVWPQLLASAQEAVKPPEVRALRSEDGAVWVLAPRWEGRNIRGGLVLVRGAISGRLHLLEHDRPLLTYDVEIPRRNGYGWIEADTLLPAS